MSQLSVNIKIADSATAGKTGLGLQVERDGFCSALEIARLVLICFSASQLALPPLPQAGQAQVLAATAVEEIFNFQLL